MARGEIGTGSVELVGLVCQITPLSFGNLLVSLLIVLFYFSLHFKKLNNVYLQYEVR